MLAARPADIRRHREGEMLSPVTPRLLMLYVFLFAFFFPDVNARSLALKNDKPQQPKDKVSIKFS